MCFFAVSLCIDLDYFSIIFSYMALQTVLQMFTQLKGSWCYIFFHLLCIHYQKEEHKHDILEILFVFRSVYHSLPLLYVFSSYSWYKNKTHDNRECHLWKIKIMFIDSYFLKKQVYHWVKYFIQKNWISFWYTIHIQNGLLK